MAVQTRAEFIQYCLRKLGSPINSIDVTEDQINDRVDEALKLFQDYHYDATERTYFKYQVTAQDITNRYITLPDTIYQAIRLFNPNGMTIGTALFDVRYQLVVNNLYNFTSQSIVPYYISMQHLTLLQQIIEGSKQIRFNKMSGRLNIDMNWDLFNPGEFIIVECQGLINPTDYPKIWGDRWLQNYTTALIKEQWGANLSKFSNMPLPGGLSFNSDYIVSSARQEVAELRQELENYSTWNQMYIG